MRYPMTILASLLAAYLVILLLSFLFQAKLVFFPGRRIAATPALAGLDYEDVFFTAEDGVRLHGWFVPSGTSGPVLLFFHGNAGNIADRLESLRLFVDVGLSVFIFDYRGFGRSEGRITEGGSYKDATAAYRYLTTQRATGSEQIIYFGRSLGAAVAIELATRYTPRGLIVESAFTSIPELGARLYRWLPVRWLARIRYDSSNRLQHVLCPKLIIHSREDEIVPFDMGERLFALAGDPKQFLEISGDHNSGFLQSRERYIHSLAEFLESTR